MALRPVLVVLGAVVPSLRPPRVDTTADRHRWSSLLERLAPPASYRFASSFTVAAPPAEVFAVLHDVAGYDRWWAQVRATEVVGPGAVRVNCRSFLPFDLTFVVTEAVADEGRGVLEGTLHGHLDGWSRWVLAADGPGCTAVAFEEGVVTTRPVMNLLAPIARPLFGANHTRMMRDCATGLRAHLAA